MTFVTQSWWRVTQVPGRLKWLMQRLAGRAVFTVGRRKYRWEDVVLAGHLWGDVARLEHRTREAIACHKRLDDGGEALTEAEVEGAAEEWRYERDLLSADDLLEWLTARGIDMDNWLGYIDRLALLTRWSTELDGIVRAYEVSSDEVDAAMYVEAVCSGILGVLAERLAGQAAVYDRLTEPSSRSKTSTKSQRKDLLAALPAHVKRRGVIGVAPAATRERADLVADIVASFDRFVDEIAAPAALEREIEAHALDWTRMVCETVAFSSEEAAREAALLIREDGMRLRQAAKVATAVVRKAAYVLEDVDGELKDRLVGALPGELIGPLDGESGSLLVWVVDRVSPSITDAPILARARERVIRRTIRREISRRVRWHERF